jgi:hypothetical protein
MPIEGYVDYRKREFCRDVKCPVQGLLDGEKEGSTKYEEIRALCKAGCMQTAHGFHKWLDGKGFLIVRPKN